MKFRKDVPSIECNVCKAYLDITEIIDREKYKLNKIIGHINRHVLAITSPAITCNTEKTLSDKINTINNYRKKRQIISIDNCEYCYKEGMALTLFEKTMSYFNDENYKEYKKHFSQHMEYDKYVGIYQNKFVCTKFKVSDKIKEIDD